MWSLMLVMTLAFLAGVHQARALVVQRTRTPLPSILARAQAAGVTFEAVFNRNASNTVDAVDLRYITNITVNGQNFRVMVDTGSVDLWLVTPSGFQFQDTGVPVSNVYGGGLVNGTLGIATVQLGPYQVTQQAFNNAKSVSLGLVLDLGLDGLIGMSFSGQGDISNIAQAAQAANMAVSVSTPFIFNIFDQTPTQNNFLGISLSRTDDQEGTADASFTINELDPTYAAVQNAPVLPLFPGNIGQWGFLIEGMTLNGVALTMPPSNVAGTPLGQLVFRLDTGTPLASLPQALIDAIYTPIPGSHFGPLPLGDKQNTWSVPCNTTAILSLQIAGQQFPIHPLDLSDVVIDPSTGLPLCVTPFSPMAPSLGFDILAGDSFMRNFYSVFNFGEISSQAPGLDASVQLLSQTNAQTAAQDAMNVRTALLASPAANGRQSGSATGSGAAGAPGPSATPSGKKNSAPGQWAGMSAPRVTLLSMFGSLGLLLSAVF